MPHQHRTILELADTAGRTYVATFTPAAGPTRPWHTTGRGTDTLTDWTALARALDYLHDPDQPVATVTLTAATLDQQLTSRWAGACLHPARHWWRTHDDEPWRATGRSLDRTTTLTYGSRRGPRQAAGEQPVDDPTRQPALDRMTGGTA